jgi:hypothetical protein
MEPNVDQFKPEEKMSQDAAESLQLLSVVSLFSEQQQSYLQTLEITGVRPRLKVQHKRNETNQKHRSNNLSIASNASIQLSLSHRPRIRVLPLIATCLAQLSLYLFSIL